MVAQDTVGGQAGAAPFPLLGFFGWRSQFDDLLFGGLPDDVCGENREGRGGQRVVGAAVGDPQATVATTLPFLPYYGSHTSWKQSPRNGALWGVREHVDQPLLPFPLEQVRTPHLCTSWRWGCGSAWCPPRPPRRSSALGCGTRPPWSAGLGGARSQRCAQCTRGYLWGEKGTSIMRHRIIVPSIMSKRHR